MIMNVMDVKKRLMYILPILTLAGLSGCYSAMHTAKVVDGPSLTLAAYPVHHEIEYLAPNLNFALGGDYSDVESYDIISSVAFKYGWAAQREGEAGTSFGITLDIKSGDEVGTEFGRSNTFRSNYFVSQSFKHSIFMGFGLEGQWLGVVPVPSSLYTVLSKDMGDRWEIYAEGQVGWLEMIGSLGIKFHISKYVSLLAQVSAVRYDDCGYSVTDDGTIIGNTTKRATAPLVAIGFVVNRSQESVRMPAQKREKVGETISPEPPRSATWSAKRKFLLLGTVAAAFLIFALSSD